MSLVMAGKAFVPALFSAATWTVSEFLKVYDNVDEDAEAIRDMRFAYIGLSFVSIVAGQTLANYKYQKKAEDKDYKIDCCIDTSRIAYIMALFKSMNGAMGMLHAVSAINESVNDIHIGWKYFIAFVFSWPQLAGQLASIMVDPDSIEHRDKWRDRVTGGCASNILAAFIIMGNGFGTWLYDNSVYHSLQELFGSSFFYQLTDAINFINISNNVANDPEKLQALRNSALYMLGNALPFLFPIVSFFGVLTFLVVNQGWMEKWNKFLNWEEKDENAGGAYRPFNASEGNAEEPIHLTLYLQCLHSWVCYTGEMKQVFENSVLVVNPNGAFKMERVERAWTRNTVTHYKGAAGGFSAAAMLHKVLKDDFPELGSSGISSAVIILPIVAIMGHDVLSWMHNFVNTTKHKETTWTISGAPLSLAKKSISFFTCGRYCQSEVRDEALLENQFGCAAVELDGERAVLSV